MIIEEDTRLDDIEMALAHHEKVISDLSDIIGTQWKEIEDLKRKLTTANAKIAELETSHGNEDNANVKPPHW